MEVEIWQKSIEKKKKERELINKLAKKENESLETRCMWHKIQDCYKRGHCSQEY